MEDELVNEESQVDLGSLIEILLRRKKIFILFSISFFLLSTTNLIYRRIKKPIFQGSFIIMISDPFINTRSQNNSIENLALNRESVDIPTLVQYLKSPGVVSNVAKKSGIPPISLINRIRITVPRNDGGLSSYLSKTLLISLEGVNKLKMQKLLNDLSEQYVINASESRNKKLSEGIKFLNNQKPKILLRVEEAQNRLEEFRLKNKIINPIDEGNKLTNLIEKNGNQILALESENLRLLFIKENLVNGILYTEGMGGETNSTNNSAGLGIMGSDQLLLQEILNVKSQLANAQSKYKKSSIVINNLSEKLRQLEPILLKNQKSAVEAAIIVNNSLIKSYENQLSELKDKFILIPSKVTKYSGIIQDLEASEKNLQSLNETKDKLELDLSQGTLPWKIIKEPLVNPNPIKPEISRNLIYIILSSISIGSLVTYILEKFDDVFHNPKEVEKFINLPVLGFVPFFNFNNKNLADNEINNKENKKISISDFLDKDNKNLQNNTKFIFEETFRNIYTSIKFSNSDKDIKIVNITSTIPEEGKSLCSLFLAINTSQISKKVLIIDADLRKPTLHKRLEVDNILGMSNYLVNKDKDWKKYINQHERLENLSFMTSGKIPPNSISLLESKKMKSFIEELRNSKEYDLIILDCPPILGLSDALIISNCVDASILTISLNKVNKKLSKECLKKLKLIDKPIIGTIINTVKEGTTNNYFGNRYYSYGNQYSYYSYKYMPKEIQTRYFEEIDIENSNKKIERNNFKNKTLFEKSSLIIKSFVKWINE